MTNLKNFAAQQLTKKQMNDVKGGLKACLLMDKNMNASVLYIQDMEEDLAREQAANAGGALYCKKL